MKDGGGLVIVHAADNAFPGWEAFNEMIGVGGWRGRNEKAGPFWYYKDGKLVSDPSPGNAGAHCNRVPFQMTVRDANHPTAKGLPQTWIDQRYELCGRLPGPGKKITLYATTSPAPENTA